MTMPAPAPSSAPARPTLVALGLALLAAGCLGHLLAAHAIGGSRRAYGDHMLGFVGIAVITGGVIALVGRKFWPGRSDITVLAIGAVQAAFGLWIWTQRFNIH